MTTTKTTSQVRTYDNDDDEHHHGRDHDHKDDDDDDDDDKAGADDDDDGFYEDDGTPLDILPFLLTPGRGRNILPRIPTYAKGPCSPLHLPLHALP